MGLTLEDVAQRSGYSQATISRVVNNSAGVRPEVRAAVEKAIKDLGYLTRRSRAGAAAEQVIEVILHRSGSVEQIDVDAKGVAVGPLADVSPETILTPQWQLGNDFHLRILNGIVAEMKVRGGKAQLQFTSDLASPALQQSLAKGAAPVLLVGEGGAGLEQLLARCRRPVVLVDMLGVGDGHEAVTTDNLAGIGLAVEHLASLGHRRIAYIGGSDLPANRERGVAFVYHSHRLGLETDPQWRDVHYDHIESTAERLVGLLGQAQRPTGIVCCNDYGALAVLRAAGRLGVSVPRELSVVGFDDVAMAALSTPALTCVRVDSEDIGRTAVRLLLSQRSGMAAHGCIVRLTPRLIVRESTAPPAG
jgi:DNA-binding LacI/PurR family transcriptional regulator